mmetsp:Transcript_44738/g.116357  ORF Transcript_44738/g.116357 Transcript_44738/m.116357 type:complete len:270 (+) Transcript_44738:132-941(+)
MAAAVASPDVLRLGDGTEISIAKVPGVDDSTWGEVMDYLQGNPDVAKKLQAFSKDPEAMRGWLQTQAMSDHYQRKLGGADDEVQGRMRALEQDPELAPIIEDIKKHGMEAVMKHYQDEELMLKFSKAMGGVPEELKPALKKIDETPLSLHEAAKMGDLKAVQEHIEKKRPLDTQDPRGITPLGYAVGGNRIAVVKLLLDSRANPFAVDSNGNSALHYAAGYGRKELVEYLLKTGGSVAQANAQGRKPLDVATQNKHEAVIQVLRAHGAQ